MNALIATALLLIITACQPRSNVMSGATGVTPHKSLSDPTAVVDGTVNGGGGKGVLCRDASGNQSLQSLDLYESTRVWGTKTKNLNDSGRDHLDNAAELLARHYLRPGDDPAKFKDDVRKHIEKEWQQIVRFAEKGTRLRDTADANEVLVDPSCEAVQIAVYYNETVLLIDEEYWNALDLTNRTALVIHEFAYKFSRDKGATDSVNTRRFVSHLMSEAGIPAKLSGITDLANTIECAAHSLTSGARATFLVHPLTNQDSSTTTEIVFQSISGVPTEFRLAASWPIVKPADFLSPFQSNSFGGGAEIRSNPEGTSLSFRMSKDQSGRKITIHGGPKQETLFEGTWSCIKYQ